MEQNELINFDWAAKQRLRDKANFGVLEGLIEVVLGFSVTIIEILEEWVHCLRTGKIDPHTQAPGLAKAREVLTIAIGTIY